jgi:hypothetical protein
MMNASAIANRFLSNKYIAYFFAFAGALWYFVQSVTFAHHLPTIVDEGNYLVKGLLFVSGRYTPFQANGPWTNQMPFSYLIPGFVETIFGAGLRTGRYFSIVLGLLMLLGLWILGRRLGNLWWAAGMVWIIAINPAYSRVYSLAVSQVLTACIFTWVLLLVLEFPNRPWRFILAGGLAGLLVVTRLNMTPVLPFLVLFIFWQFGWKSGLLSLASGFIVIMIGHAFFWPDILQTWANWIPEKISPFLDPWRLIDTGRPIWNPTISLGNRIDSLVDGIQANFIPMLGLFSLGVLVLQPSRWNNKFYYRSAVFLTSLTVFLVVLHGWASLVNNYCVYCFAGYLMFFSPIILLLLILITKSWQPGPSKGYTIFISIFALVLCTLIGFGAAREFGKDLARIPIPMIFTGSFRSGTIPLWGILENGLGVPEKTSRWLVLTFIGCLVGFLILFSIILITRKKTPRNISPLTYFGLAVPGVLLVLGFFLSPTRILMASDQAISCEKDVLQDVEAAGNSLTTIIHENSLVYWLGGESAVPLLYIPNSSIFPAQINDGYTYRKEGNPAALSKFGFWNKELSDEWRDQADFIIILEDNYDQGWKEYLETENFIEYPRSPSINPCLENQRLRIFQRSSE